MKVHEFMHDLDLAHQELNIADTVSKMNEALSRSVTVHSHNEILGIVSREELMNSLNVSDPEKTKLKDLLGHKILSIDADANIEDARRMMDKHRIDKLVVTRQSSIIGVLTNDEVENHFKYELGSMFLTRH